MARVLHLLNSRAAHLTEVRRDAYLRAWRREIVIGLILSVIVIALFMMNNVTAAFFVIGFASIAQIIYTFVRGETYLQLRQEQRHIDKEELESLRKEMEKVGHGKK